MNLGSAWFNRSASDPTQFNEYISCYIMILNYCVNNRDLARGKTEQSKHHIDSGWEEKSTSVAEFLQYAAVNGNAIMPGVLRNAYRAAENITKFDVVIVDIDNKQVPGVPTMSFDEARNNQWLMDNAVCMWSSPGNKKYDPDNQYYGQDRYRILFKLKKEFRICDKGFNPDAHK